MKAHDGIYLDGAWRPAAGRDVIEVVDPVAEQVRRTGDGHLPGGGLREGGRGRGGGEGGAGGAH
ncbi:hypothetical protein, partial [Streptomyces sp. NPDC052127]|uniref:hypothetical protein n=1 Tax=Streptomyces sp. NPDC052127 TaxID=3155679 RepID=UPI0034476802